MLKRGNYLHLHSKLLPEEPFYITYFNLLYACACIHISNTPYHYHNTTAFKNYDSFFRTYFWLKNYFFFSCSGVRCTPENWGITAKAYNLNATCADFFKNKILTRKEKNYRGDQGYILLCVLLWIF